MNFYASFLFLILLLPKFCTAQHRALFEKGIYVQQQDTLPYRILYPAQYDSSVRYPLLVFLHGSGDRGSDNEAPLHNLPGVFLSDYYRAAFPCFIVVPQCGKGDAWVTFPGFPQSLKATDSPTTAARLALGLIDSLSALRSVDARRIYLTGYSMGGEGTFDLLTRRPGLFAAAAPVCPVADTAKASAIKNNHIWIFHGEADSVNEAKYSRLMIDALHRVGTNPGYTEYPGVGHSSWTVAYNEPDLIPWLFSHIKTNHSHTDNKPILSHQDTLLGSVTTERSWWDVLRYDLYVHPQFETRRITGSNHITYTVTTDPANMMQIDLQQPLSIDSVVLDETTPVSFRNEEHVWYLAMPRQTIGSVHTIAIFYSGTPHVAAAPPWQGGITWTRDSLNRPWIATSCQLSGASIWYPCKDHQGDEPDSGASVTIRVPDTLVGVANGKLITIKPGQNKTAIYKWVVKNPINNYGICFYVGKYINIAAPANGIAGKLPVNYWVLDYNVAKAKQHLLPQTKLALEGMEYWLGPYPFYEDGLKLVDAPYIGMEHQSAIAYGNRYQYGYKGKDISKTGWGMKYDILLVHELAHEWFGNSITTADLADKWIHEGFAGYTEILCLERWYGKQAASAYLIAKRRSIENKNPVIPRYHVRETGGADDYAKGRAIIHMIRKILNDDKRFRQLLQDMNKRFYHKITTSKEIETFLCNATGIDLRKMFEQYLHTVRLPVLEYTINQGRIRYRYNNCLPGFKMPLKVFVQNKSLWLHPTDQWQEIKQNGITGKDTLEADPDFYVTVSKSAG